MSFTEELREELRFLQTLQKELKSERKQSDIVSGWENHLVRKKAVSGKNYYYYSGEEGPLRAIKEEDLWKPVYTQFLKESDAKIEKSIEFLQRTQKHYREFSPEGIYRSMPRPYNQAYEDVRISGEFKRREGSLGKKSLYLPDAQTGIFRQQSIDASDCKNQKPFREDELRHVTGDGTRVRSKSEAIIADHLRLNHIKYQYEPELVLGSQTIRPDFEIDCVRERKLVYWEHFGMLDDPKYAAHAADKLRLYFENGFIPFDNLIITCERNGNLNTSVIQAVIDLVLL